MFLWDGFIVDWDACDVGWLSLSERVKKIRLCLVSYFGCDGQSCLLINRALSFKLLGQAPFRDNRFNFAFANR